MSENPHPEADPKESPVLATSRPVEPYYAFVTQYKDRNGRLQINTEHHISRDSDGDLRISDVDGESLYEDCEYGHLSGLLVFEGVIWATTAAWAEADEDARQAFEDEAGACFHGYDEVYHGKWRHMTAAEAAALGLIVERPNE